MKQILSILAIVVLSALPSCKKTEVKQGKNIVNLADCSDSRDSAIINFYKEIVNNGEIRHMGVKDRIIVLPIDKGSSTSSQEIFTADFSLNEYTNEFSGMDAEDIEKKRHQDSLSSAELKFSQAFDCVFVSRKDYANATDIIGGLQQARKYYIPGHTNLIVILSDMLQSMGSVDFEKKLNSPDDVDSYLQQMEKIDLKGFQIIVLTGKQPNITSEKFKLVQSFWERYFKSCNADLIDYSSGAVTKLVETIKK